MDYKLNLLQYDHEIGYRSPFSATRYTIYKNDGSTKTTLTWPDNEPFHIFPHIIEWLDENKIEYKINNQELILSKEDAMAFKLRWL